MARLKRSSVQCPSCGSEETIQVKMSLAGSPTTFTLCYRCEWKGWERAGEDLELESVLSLAATPKR